MRNFVDYVPGPLKYPAKHGCGMPTIRQAGKMGGVLGLVEW